MNRILKVVGCVTLATTSYKVGGLRQRMETAKTVSIAYNRISGDEKVTLKLDNPYDVPNVNKFPVLEELSKVTQSDRDKYSIEYRSLLNLL
jgi:uncharacterized protein with LGFP repeats